MAGDRPVKCALCGVSMYYHGDPRHVPEVKLDVLVPTPDGYVLPGTHYVHLNCWQRVVGPGEPAPAQDSRDAQSPCPLNNEHRNEKARYSPANAATAHCFQLHDTLRNLYAVAHSSNEAWHNMLAVLQAQLDRAKETTLPS